MQRIILSVVVLLAWLFPLAAPAAEPFDSIDFSPDMPTILLHDELIDDYAAQVPEARHFRATRGRDTLFVAVDGDVGTKARARHNLLNLFGMNAARVVAGNGSPRSSIGYVKDYLDDERKGYLRKLASRRGFRSWIPGDYRRELREFVARHERVRVWFLANPLSFVDVIDDIDPKKIDHMVAMGLWGQGPGGTITKYNGHVDEAATKQLLAWTAKHKRPLFMIPSELFNGLDDVGAAIHLPRERLFRNPAHGAVMKELREGMNRFGKDLADALVRGYGPQPWLEVWDHETREWYQDLLTVAIATDLHRSAAWKPVSVALRLDQPGALGFGVDVRDEPASSIYVATRLEVPRLSGVLRDDYRQTSILPDFDPAKAVDATDRTPIGIVGMPAIDVLGGVGALLGLGDRLRLVITDTGSTPTSAAIFRRYFEGYGRTDIEVVAGRGHRTADMERIPALWLEALLVKNGGYSQAMFNERERERLLVQDPSALSGGDSLIRFLDAHAEVDLMIFSTVDALHEVVTKRPALLHRIRRLHMMGGVRGGKSEAGSVDWTEGEPTRNWATEPGKTVVVLDALDRYRIPTLVYSSHVAGGILNAHRFPRTVGILDGLRGRVPVEREVAAMRMDWSRALKTRVKNLDVVDNYGPRLGWIMSVVEALGSGADRHFSFVPGHFGFDGSLVSFKSDADSAVKLLVDIESDENYGVLDAVTAHLRRRAAETRSLWRRLSGRIVAPVLDFFCPSALEREQ